jgi:hypothetical protein
MLPQAGRVVSLCRSSTQRALISYASRTYHIFLVPPSISVSISTCPPVGGPQIPNAFASRTLNAPPRKGLRRTRPLPMPGSKTPPEAVSSKSLRRSIQRPRATPQTLRASQLPAQRVSRRRCASSSSDRIGTGRLWSKPASSRMRPIQSDSCAPVFMAYCLASHVERPIECCWRFAPQRHTASPSHNTTAVMDRWVTVSAA